MSKVRCSQCKKLKDRKEISYPDLKSPYKNMPVCQNCLVKLLIDGEDLKI